MWQRALLFSALACVLFYAGDYLSVQYRIPNREQFGAVRVQRYYAVRLKNRKTDYMFQPPESQACVHSLLPHYGDNPCWYVEKHKRQEIDIDTGAGSDFWRVP